MMKSITKVNLLLAIVNVCIGTGMIVLSAITMAKHSKAK